LSKSNVNEPVRSPSPAHSPPSLHLDLTHDSGEECDWDGTVNHCLSSDSDYAWTDSDTKGYNSDETEYLELEGEDFLESLQNSLQAEMELLGNPTPYETIKRGISVKDWKKLEQTQGFGYTGNSDRTKWRNDKKARDKEGEDMNLRKS
jgi:hypothetical protein